MGYIMFDWDQVGEASEIIIARNLGHETPRAVTRGNLKTDRDAEVYRDLYGHSRKNGKYLFKTQRK